MRDQKSVSLCVCERVCASSRARVPALSECVLLRARAHVQAPPSACAHKGAMWYVHMLFSSHNLMTHAHTQSDHLLRRSRIRRGKVSKRLQTTTPSLPPSPPRSFDILSLSMRKRARKGSCKHFGREGIPAHTHASRHCVETHPATPRNPQFSSRCLAPACGRPPLPMSNRVSPAGPKDPAAQGVPLHPHAPASGSDIDDALSSEGACANGHPSHGHKGTHVHNADQQRPAPHTTHSCRATAVAYPSSLPVRFQPASPQACCVLLCCALLCSERVCVRARLCVHSYSRMVHTQSSCMVCSPAALL